LEKKMAYPVRPLLYWADGERAGSGRGVVDEPEPNRTSHIGFFLELRKAYMS